MISFLYLSVNNTGKCCQEPVKCNQWQLNVMLLQLFIHWWKVTDNQLPQNSLISLDTLIKIVGLMFNFQTYSSATLIVKTILMVAIIYHVHNTSLDNMKSLLNLREIFNWPLSETWDYIAFIYMGYVHTDLTRKLLPTPQPIWWITNLGQSFFFPETGSFLYFLSVHIDSWWYSCLFWMANILLQVSFW